MAFTWSAEQTLIFKSISDLVQSGQTEVVTIEAVAGSAKSSSMVETASRLKQLLPLARVEYLIFGSLASQEARREFGVNAIVSTLHKLAHDYIIKLTPMHLSPTGFLSWKNIPKSVKRPFGIDSDAIDLVNDFAESSYLKLDLFVTSSHKKYSKSVVELARTLFKLATTGAIPCTHSIYLKVFHIRVMSDRIVLPACDLLVVDESQDLSPITMDIVKKHPARVKVLVGDPNQAIFGYLGAVDAFKQFPDATKLNLSKSFRVHTPIAELVEHFCREMFNPDLVFTGMEYSSIPKIKSRGYLTRTNAALIGKMIDLNKSNTPYRLATKTKITQMFELPLALLRASAQQVEKSPKFKYLEHDAKDYYASPVLQQSYKSCLQFLAANNEDNPAISQAVLMIGTHSPQGVIDAFNSAKSHLNTPADLLLCSIHNSKGTTVDSVELDPDTTKALDNIMINYKLCKRTHTKFTPTKDEREQLYCYYVACTRARYEVIGADYLDLASL